MADDECGEAASSGEAVQITDGQKTPSGSRMAAIFSAVAGETARFLGAFSSCNDQKRRRFVSLRTAGSSARQTRSRFCVLRRRRS
jgi:hypothetical protein